MLMFQGWRRGSLAALGLRRGLSPCPIAPAAQSNRGTCHPLVPFPCLFLYFEELRGNGSCRGHDKGLLALFGK